MEGLMNMLHDDGAGHSLVLQSDTGEIFVYGGRGITDLLCLLTKSPDLLRGAMLADKVVGKAAAALMILGGVKAVYAETVSESALQLFADLSKHTFKGAARHVEVSYGNMVDHIVNRTNTGWCPMELACKDAPTAEDCLVCIKEKMEELARQKQ